MKRITELDLTKTFIIIVSMIGIHTMYDLADLGPSVPADILNVLATAWGAPVFMFCMGITLGFSRHQNPGDWFSRGIHLITAGMALNMLRYLPKAFTSHATNDPELLKELAQVFNADILQFAGLAFILLALCKKMKMSVWQLLAFSLLLNISGTILADHYTSSYVANQILGYFYHTPTCSCFPLFNWFIFVAAGNLLGRIYRESEDIDRVFRHLMPICGVVAIVHQYLSITGQATFFKTLQNDWEFYDMETPDALCIAFGVAPFMLGIFRLAAKLIPDNWMEVLSYPSRHINQFYCVSWVWIMWIACFLYFIEPATTFAAFIPRWTAIAVLTTISVVIYNRYLQNRISPLFSSHETAWNIGVWTIMAVFGFLYFTSVPGPYIMPY